MIQKFKNFDKDEFLAKKNAVKEANEPDTDVMEMPKIDVTPEEEEEAITGTPVYENPYLLKISNIILKKLDRAELGEFGVGYNVVYLNNEPGVRIFQIDGDKTIVCCRGTQGKSISIFKDFVVGGKNTSIKTYTTNKLGFTDMLNQMIDDLQVVEVGIEEAAGDRYGLGWKAEKEVVDFERLDHDEREYIYSLITKWGKSTGGSQFVSLLDSGDKIALKIWEKYRGKPGIDKVGGPVKYMMDLAEAVMNGAKGIRVGGSVQRAIDAGILDNLIADYKGGAPAIVTRSDVEYEVGEEVDAFEAKRIEQEKKLQRQIEEDAENYRETVREMRELSEAMCNYVKNNGKLDADDKSIMSRRGVLITGKGGIGKTYTLKEVLKEKHMTLNKDYVWAGSGNSTADSVYQLMYEYNGKMLVFDDSPNLFDGGYRISMWKNALQTEIEDCLIGYPGKDSKLRVYNVRRLKGDRQRRYFTEIGRKSEEDKLEFQRKAMKKQGLKFSSYSTGKIVSEEGWGKEEIDLAMQKIEDMWEEEKANTLPAMPNEFIFKGVVVIISNYERERFIEEVGRGNWDAISSRFRNFDISPKAQALWIVMKEKILKEYNDTSIPDMQCCIPRDMVEVFIEEVETLLADPSGAYQSLNWRTITMFHDVLSGAPGRRAWKRTLRDELSRK